MTPVKIWVDATEFENKGGWKLDTQFVHLMGSGYLIAADMPGVPVEDASVDVTIPKAGTLPHLGLGQKLASPPRPGTVYCLGRW